MENPVAAFVDIEDEPRIEVKVPIDPERLEAEHDGGLVAKELGDLVYQSAMDLLRKRDREENRAARREQEQD
jgi:hypothetical protein